MGSNEPPGSSSLSFMDTSSQTPAVATSSTGGLTYEHASQSLWVALGINLGIAGIKFGAWAVSRSPAMLGEALHSLGDGINSVALLIGIYLSRREPDRTHPFGYGLEASVWAIPACAFLLVFSMLAVWEGWSRLWHTETVQFVPGFEWLNPYYFSAVVLLISISLEVVAIRRASQAVLEEFGMEARGLDLFVQAFRQIRHVVGPTTRFVFYEEGIALLGAVLALVAITLSHLAEVFGLLPLAYTQWPDAIASILIGFMLMGMSIYLFRHNRSILTGSAASPRTEKRIRELVVNLHGVSEVLDLKTIDHGLAGLNIHLKLKVEPYTMVKDVDDLTDRIREKLLQRISNASQVFIEVLADESEIEWGQKFNSLIESGRIEGVLNAREEAILRNVYDFTEATIRDVMIPRIDVEYVELGTPLAEVADLILETGHSRLPVYKENVDDIVGVVHARDVFARIRQGQLDIPLADIMREIDIYPENKPVADLLEEFKRNKIRMAAVADEHGGFAGLVTVEDLMEEIIGEIWDDHQEEEEALLTFLEPGKLLVNGKYDVEDLNDELNLSFPHDEFKTMGGFVFGELGREPEQGDVITFEDLTLTVTEVDGPRVVAVMIESPDPFRRREDQVADASGNGHGDPDGYA